MDFPPQTTFSRHKRKRAQLSCEQCRRSKLRCDRVRPICSTCRFRGNDPLRCSFNVSSRTRESVEETTAAAADGEDEKESSSSSGRGPIWQHDDGDLALPRAIRTARALLPHHPSQLDAILGAHSIHVNPTLPTYDTRAMHRWALEVYEGHTQEEEEETATRLAWICAAMSATYAVVAPIRLILWGIVDDEAASVSTLTQRCLSASMDCFHAALDGGSRPSTRSLVQAGVSLLTTPNLSPFPPSHRSAILDACVRIARRLGLDRLGCANDATEARDRITGRALWLALVVADWDAAPSTGSYAIFPGTFTTEWGIDLDDLGEAVEEEERLGRSWAEAEAEAEAIADARVWREDLSRMCMWPWFMKVATSARLLSESVVGHHTVVDYDVVLALDARIQAYLDELPFFLRTDLKKDALPRSDYVQAKRKRPALRIQACHIATGFRGTLLSLHLPHLIRGYTDPNSQQTFSIERALTMAGLLSRAFQRLFQKNLLMDRPWRSRHLHFQAGLVLTLDLLLVERPRTSHREMSEQLAFVIDALGNDPLPMRTRPGGLHESADLSGASLKRLLVDGIKQRGSRGRPIGLLQEYVAEYSHNTLGIDTAPAAATLTAPSYLLNSASLLPNHLLTPPQSTEAAAATPLPRPVMDSSTLLDSLLTFTASEDDDGPSIEALLSDPFLFGP